MPKVNRFEDLRCWQEARVLVREIYRIAEEGRLSKDYETRSQLKRAALSCMNNIAEGFGKYSSKEFIHYLDTAHNSASEVKSMLYVLFDLEYVDKEKIMMLQEKTEEVKASILAFIKYLSRRG
ncbi:MAG: four helix bundle protein [Bacteroidota bacterium]|jgi:four helix bundle protein|nr:MAG: four helix bundle protein [Bacteroidota bacterium]